MAMLMLAVAPGAFGDGTDVFYSGETFRDCPDCPEMVVVPAGSFMMGSPPSEKDRGDDEGPVHQVVFAEPFAVGVFEVTFAEWDACVSAGGCGGSRPSDYWGWGRGSRPVYDVDWYNAQSYVRWLSRWTGEDYRLLSESEWEYVARAGTSTRYWWGNDIGRGRANCQGCGGRWDAARQWDDRGTAPVGSFTANAFGLHDVHGNISEWTQDRWRRDYEGVPGDGSAWVDREEDPYTLSSSRRVVRGGNWYNDPRYLRSASRSWGQPSDMTNRVGFRVARTLPPETTGMCIEFQETITNGGQTEEAYELACEQPDGTWQPWQPARPESNSTIGTWSDPTTGTMGTYTPLRTEQTETGQYCREFRQTLTVDGETKEAYGRSCRQLDGTWAIIDG